MSPVSCLFCGHPNPVGSKFCNECGSPLHLNPCPECATINEHDAPKCYQCGAGLGSHSVLPAAAEHVAACDAGTAPATSEVPSTDPVRSLDIRALFEERLDALRREMANQGEATTQECAAALPDPATADAAPVIRAPADAAPVIAAPALSPVPWAPRVPRLTSAVRPVPRARSQRALYAAVTGSLVVGIATSGYYVYGPSVQVDRWLSALSPGTLALPGSYPAAAPTRSITQIGNGVTPWASPEPREVSGGSSSDPAEKLAGAAPRTEPPASQIATAGAAPAVGSDTADVQWSEATPSESPTPSRSAEAPASAGPVLAGPVSAGATSAGPASAEPLSAAPAPASAVSVPSAAARAPTHASRAAHRRADRPRTANTRSLPASGARIARAPDTTRTTTAIANGRGCPRDIAALGLCTRGLQEQAR
ncbi:MAG: hypothetical protein E6H78_11005 [Betaproteobacteria bacterium]|nr:MAG: hypothetical protein E6H78_11005 [Betaproteobacteria bacterium]